MAGFVQRFCADEHGAVTVDWVVMTTMLVTIGIVLVEQTRQGGSVMATNLQTQLRADLPTIVEGD